MSAETPQTVRHRQFGTGRLEEIRGTKMYVFRDAGRIVMTITPGLAEFDKDGYIKRRKR